MPVILAAMVLGGAVVGMLSGVIAVLVGEAPALGLLGQLAVSLPVGVVAWLVLRRLVARWVARHPPRSP